MRRKRTVGILIGVTAMIVAIAGVLAYERAYVRNTPEEMISRLEGVLGDEYEKQSMTELAATVTYEKEGGKIKFVIMYCGLLILKRTRRKS